MDKFGRSLVHYIVNPCKFGSFENTELLLSALKFGFQPDLIDYESLTPLHYAARQSTRLMIKIFEDFLGEERVDSIIASHKDAGPDVHMVKEWPNVDYLSDSQTYLESVKMKVDSDHLVPADSVGKFNKDSVVYRDDSGWYDTHLSRVEVGRGKYGDYLFYKMQIV
jgi:hypothetical protein